MKVKCDRELGHGLSTVFWPVSNTRVPNYKRRVRIVTIKFGVADCALKYDAVLAASIRHAMLCMPAADNLVCPGTRETIDVAWAADGRTDRDLL